MSRTSAYYSRNDSFSRSYNASVAEEEGRFPRTRAAAFLGLSVKAFDAACAAVGYRPTEWHHVGKYAAMVDYYDAAALDERADFWQAAMAVSSPARRKQIAQRLADKKAARIEAFRQKLIAQRDCTRPVRRHDGAANWRTFCRRQWEAAGLVQKDLDDLPTERKTAIAPGDSAALDALIALGRCRREKRLSDLRSGFHGAWSLGRELSPILADLTGRQKTEYRRGRQAVAENLRCRLLAGTLSNATMDLAAVAAACGMKLGEDL